MALNATKDYSLFDMAEEICAKGWQIVAYTMPMNSQELVVMRVLVRRGFSYDLAQLMIKDLVAVIGSLEEKTKALKRSSFAH
ncbi:Glutamate decarboxylase [Francisella sp. MA067296]|nr:Glutamate decarboxylase [Francisella sp. MA067296]